MLFPQSVLSNEKLIIIILRESQIAVNAYETCQDLKPVIHLTYLRPLTSRDKNGKAHF